MTKAGSNPEDALPLTAAVLSILMALAAGEKHGYGIMKSVAEPDFGSLRLGPGTLYGALDRMVEAKLVEETGTTDNERRRYYRLTKWGFRVLGAEIARLSEPLAAARRRGWQKA